MQEMIENKLMELFPHHANRQNLSFDKDKYKRLSSIVRVNNQYKKTVAQRMLLVAFWIEEIHGNSKPYRPNYLKDLLEIIDGKPPTNIINNVQKLVASGDFIKIPPEELGFGKVPHYCLSIKAKIKIGEILKMESSFDEVSDE